MKNKSYFTKLQRLISWPSVALILFAFLITTVNVNAQTTITTTYPNNNGSSVVVFSFINNNSSAVIIDNIGSLAGVTNTYTCYLYAKPATYGVAPGAVGVVSAANGWTVVGSNTSLSLTGNTTGSGSAATTFISGINYMAVQNLTC